MLDTAEQRNFPRLDLECPASFTVSGDGQSGAIVKNLSGGGLLMWIEGSVAPETVITIEVTPVNKITPPMKAQMKVLRCTPVEGAEGQFAVACAMQKILE